VKPTPFHDRTSRLNRRQMWFNWDEHVVPDAYGDLASELRATRERVSMGDMSPLSKYEVRGSEAPGFIDRLVTRDTSTFEVGQVMYSPWTDEAGMVVGDGLLFRVGGDAFRISADPQLLWFRRHAEGLDVTITDLTDAYGLLAIQGPAAREVMDALTGETWEDLSFSRIRTTTVAGVDLTVARQGFTGELGYEMWVPAAAGVAVWDAVAAAGLPFGIEPVGEHAIDVARVEAGLLIVGADYTGAGPDRPGSTIDMDDAHRASPFELNLDTFVDLEKEFVGRDALRDERDGGGPGRRLAGLVLDHEEVFALHASSRLPSIPDRVWWYPLALTREGDSVGRATSVTWAPTVGRLVGFAHLGPDLTAPGTGVTVGWTLHGGDDTVRATVVDLPFLERRRSL
jgi:aminomethyltransferase